jgi:hypothetical protein
MTNIHYVINAPRIFFFNFLITGIDIPDYPVSQFIELNFIEVHSTSSSVVGHFITGIQFLPNPRWFVWPWCSLARAGGGRGRDALSLTVSLVRRGPSFSFLKTARN